LTIAWNNSSAGSVGGWRGGEPVHDGRKRKRGTFRVEKEPKASLDPRQVFLGQERGEGGGFLSGGGWGVATRE